MGLPEPTLSFTIPSLLDATQLECRIYHPTDHGKAQPLDDVPEHVNTAAIVAHPYAPLGGCFDVPVVVDVVSALLKENVTVGTFNFRGAGASKGRTTWTGKGEVADYESFVVFLLSYLAALRETVTSARRVHQLAERDQSPNDDTVAEQHAKASGVEKGKAIKLVLAGYSYGSLVVMRLPPFDQVLKAASDPMASKSAGEIFTLARSLGRACGEDLSRNPRGSRSSHIRVGSGDVSRSRGTSRDGTHKSRSASHILRHLKHRGNAEEDLKAQSNEESIQSVDFPDATPFYLLVSPILPPASSLVMLSMSLRQSTIEEPEGWTEQPAFAIFGDRDGFTSIKKLTPWAQRLRTEAKHPDFQYTAVTGAGHFWIEEGVMSKMKAAVRQWVRSQVIEGLSVGG